METNKKGFAALLAILIVSVAALAGAGAYFYVSQTAKPKPVPVVSEKLIQSSVADRASTPVVQNAVATSTPPQAETRKPQEPIRTAQNAIRPTADDIANWQTYRNEKCGYEIKYPANYKPFESGANNENATFYTTETEKCNAQYGPAAMCGEGNMGPVIMCDLSKNVLNGFSTFDEYVADGMKGGVINPNFAPKTISVGNLSGIEVEGFGYAGEYKNIYLQKGDYIIEFDIEKEGNETNIGIYDQMLSTFKFVEPQIGSSGTNNLRAESEKQDNNIKFPQGNEIYAPLFDQHKISEQFSGVPAALDFSSNKGALFYKTRITDAYNSYDPANDNIFAGHYVVAIWGCGTGCRMGSMADLKDGKIYDIPGGESLGQEYSYYFFKNSSLLIINPIGDIVRGGICAADQIGKDFNCPAAKLYLWENNEFKDISDKRN